MTSSILIETEGNYMIYDFKAARNHIEELTLKYRKLKYTGMLDEYSSRFLVESINELEEEIAGAKEGFRSMQMPFREV